MSRPAAEEEFARVVQLLQLARSARGRGEISLIRAYFRMLGVFRSIATRVVPSVERWTSSERGQCTHLWPWYWAGESRSAGICSRSR